VTLLPGDGLAIRKLADEFISADVATTRATKTGSRPAKDARQTKDRRPSKETRPSKSSPSQPKDRPSAYPTQMPPPPTGIHLPVAGWIGLVLVIVLVGLGGGALLTSQMAVSFGTPPPSVPALVVLPSGNGQVVVVVSAAPSSTAIPAATTTGSGPSPSVGSIPGPTPSGAPTAPPVGKPTAAPTAAPTAPPKPKPTATPVVVAFNVGPSQVSGDCKTGPVPFQLKLDNSGSNVSVAWSIGFTSSPDVKGDWGSASPSSGTVAAGASALIDITPLKSLCPLQSQTDYELKVAYGSSGSAVVTYTVAP
jgi:hypothetical protein